MTLDELKTTNRVIGIRQTLKVLKRNEVHRLFLASDAQARLVSEILAQAKERCIAIEQGHSMKELGAACGITVGAAAVAVLKKVR